MRVYFKICLAILVFVIPIIAVAQEKTNTLNFKIGGWGSEEESPSRYSLGIGHEWKLFPYLSVELSANFGTVNDYSEWSEYIKEAFYFYENPNIKSVNGDFATVESKITGYIYFDMGENTTVFVYGGFIIGGAKIHAEGSIQTFDGDLYTDSGNLKPHLFTGMEIGIGIDISERWNLQLFARGDDIKLSKAFGNLGLQYLNKPISFNTSMPNISVGTIITFSYKKQKD